MSRPREIIHVWVTGDLNDRDLLKVMRAISWQWPCDFEGQNGARLRRPLQTLIREAVAAGELRGSLEVERVIAIVFAIYTQTVRDAVFNDATNEDCIEEIMARLDLFANGLRA